MIVLLMMYLYWEELYDFCFYNLHLLFIEHTVMVSVNKIKLLHVILILVHNVSKRHVCKWW